MIALCQITDGVKLICDDYIEESKDKTLLILLGVKADDTKVDADYIIKKIPNLRIWKDENDKMNLSSLDVSANIFVVSQFTLFAKCKKGNRPSFVESANYEIGKSMYEYVLKGLKNTGLKIKEGVFGGNMNLFFNNNGPVTIILDSRE